MANFQQEMAFAGVKVINDNYAEWRGCTRKRRFGTEQAAKNILLILPPDDGEMNVYFCEHCYGFHIGHRPRKAVQ